jgi:hypothetical protein
MRLTISTSRDEERRDAAARLPADAGRAGHSPLAELFAPLDHLLRGGGDARLLVDPASGVTQYGCRAAPDTRTLTFSSSTATTISQRAYDRLAVARDTLMQSAIADGIEAAFDARVDGMREELKASLGLRAADVVFSPSGTDSQLHALFLSRALLGGALTTIVVAADQTGSGTAFTSRGCHFSPTTANGHQVRKGEPIAGMPEIAGSVALPLLDATGHFRLPAESDVQVLGAVDAAIKGGSNVLLQIMDASKFGWRAPSDKCLDEIATRWPGQVQVVVDACQLRVGRRRLQKYLDRGYLVLITGSKYFTGPAFSGAMLVPTRLAKPDELGSGVPQGLDDYASRSDWPVSWGAVRSCFPVRANFGQWLRWEATLEEMRAYYAVPDEFRRSALIEFGREVERIVAASPSLRPFSPQRHPRDDDNEEFDQPTIFPFLIEREGRHLSPAECTSLYRALARDMRQSVSETDDKRDTDIAAQPCLIGQPVALNGANGTPVAALRICASARLVTELWSPDATVARRNLRRQIDHVATVVAKLEWLLADPNRLLNAEMSRGA